MTSSTYPTWIRNTTVAAISAIVLSGCLSEEGEEKSFSGAGGTSTGPSTSDVVLRGSVGDGPVVGADIRVYDASGALMAELQSDANATYNITISTVSSDFPLSLEARNGTDLVTNLAPDFALKGAALSSGGESIANLSPFSTIAVALARKLSGGATASNLRSAENTVATFLNSGLDSLMASGPSATPIGAGNVTEMVKASETLSELVRRSRDLLTAAGFSSSGNAVIDRLGADLTDGKIDGLGASGTDSRTAAVSTIVNAQVLLESMANELHVNGSNATAAMWSAIEQVSPSSPTVSLDQMIVTAEMITRTRVGLAAAFAIDPDPAIRQLHEVVSALQPGQNATLVRATFPAGYRSVLANALDTVAGADATTLDLVNSIARTGGDLEAANLAPSIQGTPATSVETGASYSFTPTASDPEGDVLTFSISNPPAWASFDTSTGQLSGMPLSDDVGSHTNIVISVSDGEFTSTLTAFSITVTASNSAPQISGTPSISVNAGDSYSFTPTASDPDGDTLTFSIANPPSWASFDTSTGRLSGTTTNVDDGTYANIVISVSDGEFSASLSAFSITVNAVITNAPPQISGTPTTSIDAGGNYSFTPAASDPDGDTLTFSIANPPSWASFDTTTGSLSGAPMNADDGTYGNIVISVSDGELSASLPAFSITVTAINSAPQISGSAPASVNAGDRYLFTPTVSDPDDDTLTFSILNSPSWASFDTSIGRLTGTPTNADAGTHANIVISVSDGEFSASLPAFSITVNAVITNSPPQISGTPSISVNAGDSYSFTPTASDPDGDTLTFSIANPPSWASFDTSTGRLSGTTTNVDDGTYANIVISVSDGEFSASLSAFSITVNAVITNAPPQISGTPTTSIDAGGNYSFTPAASDPDGDTLTFSIANPPSWASFDTTTGSLSGAPMNADDGTYGNIVISVSDGEFSASLPAFSITVTAINSAPQISGTPTTSINANSSYSFTPNASDPDGDSLTFSISGQPLWASFDTSTGELSGTPNDAHVGVYSNIVISVSDGQETVSLASFSISVEAISLGSATLSWTAPTHNEDGTTLTDLAGYKLYWGTTPGSYTESVTIDNPSVLTYVVENLAPGTYEFVATSFNTSGVESRYSGAATKLVP